MVPNLHLNPVTPLDSEEETTSPLAIDMDIDSGDHMPLRDDSLPLPDGYIPLEGQANSDPPKGEDTTGSAQSKDPDPHLASVDQQLTPTLSRVPGLSNQDRGILPAFI